MMKSEATLQAENDQAVLTHMKKKDPKDEVPKVVQASKRKSEMPKRPDTKRPKDRTAELLGKTHEERKKIIEDTLKEANVVVEAKKKVDGKIASLVDDLELKRRIAILAKDPNITEEDLDRLIHMLRLMQPGHAATLRAEEEMRERWERSDRYEATKGNL
eukprot:7462912-Karenia_brevis.AAC.1